MNMFDILKQAGGIGAMAQELGVDEATAQSGAAALLPAILGGFKQQAQTQPSGLGGLLGMIGGMGGGGLLASVLGAGPSNIDAGNSILGQIFGSKDVSRTVAADAATKSGVSSDLLKKMLPLIAMAVAGYMASNAGGSQSQEQPAQPSEQGGLGGLLNGALGGALGGLLGGGPTKSSGGLAGMLDMDRDGNPLDDIIKMAGGLAR
jgi:hypothetical protein